MKKKPKFEKLSINLYRRGRLEYATAYDAPEAARIATRRAKEGWEVKVQAWRSLGTKRNVFMTCQPTTSKSGKVIAACEITPTFKKRLQRR